MFLAPWFAVAGLIAAAGPILIHLLNRRRYQVVEWAAMDFLREALQRSRRILQFRDLLLLLVRTLCLALFGLALARPLLSPIGAADADQPAHAIVLLDNSLSMSYQDLDRTLLDQAKLKARQWLERLPAGSRISLVPLCGATSTISLDAYATRDDALEALAAVEVMDRAATATGAIDLALEACRRVVDMPRKQIVLFGDAQVTQAPTEALAAQLAKLPAAIQVIPVTPMSPDNAWVADFRLPDGIADPQTPASFLAVLRYRGPQPRREVQATLTVGGATVATQSVELFSGQDREVRFPPCRIAANVEPGRPRFVPATVSITHDRLPADDQRLLMVPVAAGVPVVFVDQCGASGEDARHNLLGETWSLRRLLAPITGGADDDKQLIRVRHTTIDGLRRELLADARLVVVAGVADPRPASPLLEEYVAQGGSVIIAAGGAFDPSAWTTAAWRDGLGMLPAPLRGAFEGRSPEDADKTFRPFQLDFASLVHDWFLVEQTSREELQDLYAQPWFFKTAVPELTPAKLSAAVEAVASKIAADRAEAARVERELAALGADAPERAALEARRAALAPRWLMWDPPPRDDDASPPPPAEAAERTRPRVLAAFTNGVPALVERRFGAGRVLWFSSGFSVNWNSLALSNAMLVFDRIARSLIQEAFPRRTLSTDEQGLVPIPAAQRRQRFTARGPQGFEVPLSIEPLGGDRYAAVVPHLPRRGLYQLSCSGPSPRPSADAPAWELTLAVNGPAAESELPPGDDAAAVETVWTPSRSAHLIDPSGSAPQDVWKWLIAATLLGLLGEMAILAAPALRRSRAV